MPSQTTDEITEDQSLSTRFKENVLSNSQNFSQKGFSNQSEIRNMELGLLKVNKMKNLNEQVTIIKYERDDETDASQKNCVDTFDQ